MKTSACKDCAWLRGVTKIGAGYCAKKDTIKILGDLNRAFPFAESSRDSKVHYGIGKRNKEIVLEAIHYIEEGNIQMLGEMMNRAQESFDQNVAIACPEELFAPKLHKVLNDSFIIENSYGRKGVGSQGDGTVQVLAKDYESQQRIKEYFNSVLGMKAYELTIESTKPIKKAIIPVAGNATRMYPISKCVKKAFLPIIDEDGIIKPAILSLIEELDSAGIEQICLIIDEEEEEEFRHFFDQKLTKAVIDKLSPEMLEYESHIHKLGKKLTYIVQKEKLGFGHAVSLCEEYAGGDPVLLVLGDQLYKSYSSRSCTEQFLRSFAKSNSLSISVCEVALEDVSKYGILSGKLEGDIDYFQVDSFIEKPNPNVAKERYYTKTKNGKKYFAVFGQYILTDEVFKILKKNIAEGKKEKGEYQLTSAIDEAREKCGLVAFIPKGKFLDIGNVESYKNTFIEKCSK